MKKVRWFMLLFLAVNTSFMTVSGQGDLSEDIFIRTDRDIYLPGESVWFRADYFVEGDNPQEQLSNYLYIDLINPLGESVAGSKYELKNGRAAGEFKIPNGLVTATYMVRAYTQFQRNQTSGRFIRKLITIINPAVPLAGYKKKLDWKLKVYPPVSISEGNEVVVRIHPAILTKVKEAFLTDQFGNVAGGITLFPNGLGTAMIPRQDSLAYYAGIRMKNGDTVQTAVPAVKGVGAFSYEWSGSSVKIKLCTDKTSPDQLYKLNVLDGQLISCCTLEVKADDRWYEIGPDQRLFDEKVIYLVLEDSDGNIIQVQHAMHLPDKPVELRVATSKDKYKTREKVEVTLHAAPDETFTGYVSVVKKGTYEKERNVIPVFILENPWLLPAWLEDKLQDDNSFIQQLEAALVVVDHHLKTGRLLPVSSGAELGKEWLPEARGVMLRGEVRNRAAGKPEPGSDVYLAVFGATPQLHVYTTNEQGAFFFSLKHVYGLQSVYICVGNKPEKDLEILVNSDFVRDYPSFYTAPLLLDTSTRRFIEDMYVSAQVKEYFNTEDTSSRLFAQKAIRFPEPDESIILDDYIPLPTLKDVINEITPFVRVAKKGDDFSLVVLDKKTNQLYGNPLILLDDLPVFNVNELLKINPELIERISVINSTYVYGEHVFRGIVFLETTTTNFAGMELPSSSTFLEFQTLEDRAVHTSPDAAKKDQRKPDFRNLLFWEPEITIGKNGSTITFFCSDDPGAYEVIVSGIGENSKKAFGSAVFVVSDK